MLKFHMLLDFGPGKCHMLFQKAISACLFYRPILLSGLIGVNNKTIGTVLRSNIGGRQISPWIDKGLQEVHRQIQILSCFSA